MTRVTCISAFCFARGNLELIWTFCCCDWLYLSRHPDDRDPEDGSGAAAAPADPGLDSFDLFSANS
jgi:hypothetical protein